MIEANVVRAGIYAEAGASVDVEHLVVVNAAPFRLAVPSVPLDDTGSAIEALRPESALVSLGAESDALLGVLDDWRDSSGALSVAVLRGGAGTGKTRIAAETLRRARKDGWVGGFFRSTAVRMPAEPLAVVSRPTVVVVDYAETAPSTVLRLLATLHEVAHESHEPQRLLLLVRAQKASVSFADELAAYASDAADDQTLRRTLNAALELSFDDQKFKLDPYALADIFQRAMAAFAALPSLAAGRPPAMAVPPYVGQSPFTTPLMVSAAALLELLGRERRASFDSVASVLDEVLAHERRYWLRRLVESNLAIDSKRRELAAAVFTVAPGGSRTEATELLRVLPDLNEASLAPVRDAIAGWWLGTYPDPAGCIRPIEPDLIGEHLIARTLGADGSETESEEADVLLAVAHRATPAGRRALLRTLTRAAPDNSSLEMKLHELLQRQLAEFVADARSELNNQIDEPEPLASTLTLAIEAVGALDVADKLAEDIVVGGPAENTLPAIRPLVAALAAAGANAHPDDLGRVAAALALQSSMAGLIGRPEEGLEASTEAVRIRRKQALDDPQTFRPSLARSLVTYSNRLADTGEHGAALDAILEAVAIHETLIEEGRAASRMDFGVSLNNLSARYAAIGDISSSRDAAEKALAVFDELVAGDAGEVYAADRAMALSTLANRLNALGEPAKAVKLAEESLEVRKALAGQAPEVHEPNIALVLNNISQMYGKLQEPEKARNAAEQAVEIRRRLAERNPDAHETSLARALNTLAIQRNHAGDVSGSSEAAREGMEILERFTGVRRNATTRERAGLRNSYAAGLCSAGRPAEALEVLAPAISDLERATENGETGHEYILSFLYATAVSASIALDDRAAALKAALSVVELREKLWSASPTAHRGDYARALRTLAELAAGGGDRSRSDELQTLASEVEAAL